MWEGLPPVLVRMPVDGIPLTASFKVDLADIDEATISEICRLFAECEESWMSLLSMLVHMESPALWTCIMRNIASYDKDAQHYHHITFNVPVGMPPASTSPS